MAAGPLTLTEQLHELACFFATHAPDVSPATMRLKLDDARSSGLRPPGEPLDSTDWNQLTLDLASQFAGSFPAQPLKPGQLFIYDVFDRIDSVVGAMRDDGTLCVGEIAEAVAKDEPLRVALGLTKSTGGKLTLRCKSIFQELETGNGFFQVAEFGDALRKLSVHPLAAVSPAVQPATIPPAEADPFQQIVNGLSEHLHSTKSPLSGSEMLCPGRAHIQARLTLLNACRPSSIQLNVIDGRIVVRSVTSEVLLEPGCALLEQGMQLLFWEGNRGDSSIVVSFLADSLDTNADINLEKLVAACRNSPVNPSLNSSPSLTFGFNQRCWEFRLSTEDDAAHRQDSQMLEEWHYCLTNGVSEDHFQVSGGGFRLVEELGSKQSSCWSTPKLSSSSRRALRVTLGVADLACWYRTDKEGRSYMLGRVTFNQARRLDDDVLYSPLRPFLGRTIWEPTAHPAPPINCDKLFIGAAAPDSRVVNTHADAAAAAAQNSLASYTNKPRKSTFKETCCCISAPKSDIIVPKHRKVNWCLGGVDGIDLYAGATPVDAFIEDTKRSQHQPTPYDGMSVGEALDLDTPGLNALIKSVSQVDLHKFSLDVDCLPSDFCNKLDARETHELLVDIQRELDHEEALVKDAYRVELFYNSPHEPKLRQDLKLMEYGADLNFDEANTEEITRTYLHEILGVHCDIRGLPLDIHGLPQSVPQLLEHVKTELELDQSFHAKVRLVATYLKGELDETASQQAAFDSLCMHCAVPLSTTEAGVRADVARIILIHLLAFRRGILGKVLDLSRDRHATSSRPTTAAGWKQADELPTSQFSIADTTVSRLDYTSFGALTSSGASNAWLRVTVGSRIESLCHLNALSITPSDARLLAMWMQKPQVQSRVSRVDLDRNRALCGPVFQSDGSAQKIEQDTDGFEALVSNLPAHVEDLSLSGCCLGSAALGTLHRYLDKVDTICAPPGIKQEFYNAREKRRLLSCIDDEYSHYDKCRANAEAQKRGYILVSPLHNTYEMTNALSQLYFYDNPGYGNEVRNLKPAQPGERFKALQEREVAVARDAQNPATSASELWIQVSDPPGVWLPTTHMRRPNIKVRVRCQLRRLNLSHNEGLVGLLDGSEQIATSTSTAGVDRIRGGADAHRQSFQIFCKSFSSNSILQELNLSYCGLGPVSLSALAEYAQDSASYLRILRIRGNGLSGAIHTKGGKFCVSDRSPVRTLDAQIDSNMAGMVDFFDADRPLFLKYLDIRDCGLGSASARRCALALRKTLSPNLQTLLADDDFLLDTIASEPSILGRCPRKKREDESFLLRAVSNNYRALEYVDEYVPSFGVTDRGLVQAACMTDGRALRFASSVLRADKSLVALAVCTAGRSQPYRDDFAPLPRFFEVFATKMQSDAGSTAAHDQKYRKILEEFKKHKVNKSTRACVKTKRLKTIAKDLGITLTHEEREMIISEAGDATLSHVFYDQQAPDIVYRARLAFFAKFATASATVLSEKEVERLVQEYHETEMEVIRELHDWPDVSHVTYELHRWLMRHVGSDTKQNRKMDLTDLANKSGAEERTAGLSGAVDEVLSWVHADLKISSQAKAPGLRPNMQRCADKLVKTLESGHKISRDTHLREIEEELSSGEFDSRVAAIVKKGFGIWYVDLDVDRHDDSDISGSSLPTYKAVFEKQHRALDVRIKRTTIEGFRKLVAAKQIAPTTRVHVSADDPSAKSFEDVLQEWKQFRQVGYEGLLADGMAEQTFAQKAARKK